MAAELAALSSSPSLPCIGAHKGGGGGWRPPWRRGWCWGTCSTHIGSTKTHCPQHVAGRVGGAPPPLSRRACVSAYKKAEDGRTRICVCTRMCTQAHKHADKHACTCSSRSPWLTAHAALRTAPPCFGCIRTAFPCAAARQRLRSAAPTRGGATSPTRPCSTHAWARLPAERASGRRAVRCRRCCRGRRAAPPRPASRRRAPGSVASAGGGGRCMTGLMSDVSGGTRSVA